MKFIIGKKIGMTQVFNQNGDVVPVTLIEAGPLEVLQIKNMENDSYESIQVGYVKIESKKKIKKTMKGKEFSYIKEFKGNIADYNEGDVIDLSIFSEGDKVKVSGVSKGKGFQGGVKRHGFTGRDRTHGVKHEHRTIGSVGSAYPQRVIKGRKMPGHCGFEKRTVKNLKVIKIDKDNNLLAVNGGVPGRKGTLLTISAE